MSEDEAVRCAALSAGQFRCWAANSRAYLLRQDELRPVARDHTLAQGLTDSGALAEDEPEGNPHANVITLLAALARRAMDNVTAVIVEVLPDETEPAVPVRQP